MCIDTCVLFLRCTKCSGKARGVYIEMLLTNERKIPGCHMCNIAILAAAAYVNISLNNFSVTTLDVMIDSNSQYFSNNA